MLNKADGSQVREGESKEGNPLSLFPKLSFLGGTAKEAEELYCQLESGTRSQTPTLRKVNTEVAQAGKAGYFFSREQCQG